MRPNGDMTTGQHRTPKKEEWFEGKVRELGEAIDALPGDRADLARELLEAENVPLFTPEEMRRHRQLNENQGGEHDGSDTR